MFKKSFNKVFLGVISGLCEHYKLNTMYARFAVILLILVLPFKFAICIAIAYCVCAATMKPAIAIPKTDEVVKEERL